jgi:hypothetical protein
MNATGWPLVDWNSQTSFTKVVPPLISLIVWYPVESLVPCGSRVHLITSSVAPPILGVLMFRYAANNAPATESALGMTE